MNNHLSFEQAPASLLILMATIGLSLYTLYSNRELLGRLMLHPYSVTRYNRWHLLLTSGFVHGDMAHLMFNMISFYFFAFSLETVVGTANFLIIYFGSMALADVSTVIKNKDNPDYYALGASGAISGVIFASILLFPGMEIGFILLPIGIPAPVFGLLYLAYCYYAAKRSGDMINHQAHFWGALAGVLILILIYPDVLPYFISEIF